MLQKEIKILVTIAMYSIEIGRLNYDSESRF